MLRFLGIRNVKHQFMPLKMVAKLNGYHSLKVGRKYKSRYRLESRHLDLSSDASNFSYWHMIGYFCMVYILPKKSTVFSSHHSMAYYKSPCLGLKSRFLTKWSIRKCKKRDFQQKNEVLNQLVEGRNIKLICINYHLKWRFHTIQANIHRFSDSNDLLGPILLFPNRSIEHVVSE